MSMMKTSLTIIPMCPRERFSYYKSLSGLVLCYKKDWATLLHLVYFCYLLPVTNYLITKLSVTDNFSACREYLTVTSLILIWPMLVSMWASCLNSNETWIEEFSKPQKPSKNNQHLELIKRVQENVHVILWKYWHEVKFKPIFLESQKFILGLWFKSIIYLGWNYFCYIRNNVQIFL